jgi:hypothetical protein
LRPCRQGRLNQQVEFLRLQFLQGGGLPFTDVLSVDLVAQVLAGPERIEVPAGRFNALRVEWVQTGSRMISWGRGGQAGREAGDEEVVFRLLKSFKAK